MIYERFPYRGYHGCKSFCDVEIYPIEKTVIVTERSDNTGTSVTNAAEVVARQIAVYFNVPLWDNDWSYIEHYPERGDFEESFDLVEFTWRNDVFPFSPKWKRLKDWQRPAIIEA